MIITLYLFLGKKLNNFWLQTSIAHGIEVFLKNQKFTSIASSKIKLKLNNDLLVIDWKKRNSAFMSALAVEKNVMVCYFKFNNSCCCF